MISAIMPASIAEMTAMPTVPKVHFLRLSRALIYGFKSSVPGIVHAACAADPEIVHTKAVDQIHDRTGARAAARSPPQSRARR